MSRKKILVNHHTRTAEHARVDREIREALDAGWKPNALLKNYSRFLYEDVAYGFLCDRVKVAQKRIKGKQT